MYVTDGHGMTLAVKMVLNLNTTTTISKLGKWKFSKTVIERNLREINALIISTVTPVVKKLINARFCDSGSSPVHVFLQSLN